MFKINLNPVLCISAFLLVAYCTLVPSTSSEKVSQLVLFLDRFLSIESEFKWLYMYDEEWQGPLAFYLNIKADLDGNDSH